MKTRRMHCSYRVWARGSSSFAPRSVKPHSANGDSLASASDAGPGGQRVKPYVSLRPLLRRLILPTIS